MGGARWDKGRAPPGSPHTHTQLRGLFCQPPISGEIQSTSLKTHLEPFLPAAIRFQEEEFNPSPGGAASASPTLLELPQPTHGHGRAPYLCSVLWGDCRGGRKRKMWSQARCKVTPPKAGSGRGAGEKAKEISRVAGAGGFCLLVICFPRFQSKSGCYVQRER